MIAELDAAEREGQALRIDEDVVPLLDGLFLGVRSQFLGVAAGLSHPVSLESDVNRCHEIIDDEVRRILAQLVDTAADDLIAKGLEHRAKATGRARR